MARILQINTGGAWKHVLTIRGGGTLEDDARHRESAMQAAEQMAGASGDRVHWRLIDRERGAQDVVIAAWDRERGWRSRS